ncbi:efflux RND transporter periplasmic adaptor subunit [Rubripirellula reticaptiva]|uniref:Macrolide transporter subunit MacA n=1 Tax=Rubripirellula reticaptiva TaxID=2528013 RepID=A0A5C6ET93_9BACT|nr:efflux RND transporter periplasmic adaptor subunit [Rubripirellula reticaptiva]TWU51604.1 macrolide transporter subunit MacA [Rubripirellula reticaptiva]
MNLSSAKPEKPTDAERHRRSSPTVTNSEVRSATCHLADDFRFDAAHASHEDLSIDSLQRRLQTLSTASIDRAEMLGLLVRAVSGVTNAIWVGIAQTENAESIEIVSEHHRLASQNLALSHSTFLPTIQKTFETNTAQVAFLTPLSVLCIPISANATDAECISLVLELPARDVEPFLLVGQLAAACVQRFDDRCTLRETDWQADATAAIAELLAEMASATDLADAHLIAANRIADFLNAESVVLGSCRPYSVDRDSVAVSHGRARIEGISSTTKVDQGAATAKLITAAMSESLVRYDSLGESSTDFRVDRSETGLMQLAHQSLAESTKVGRIVSYPLVTSKGTVVGVWMASFAAETPANSGSHRFAETVTPYLADGLSGARRSSEGVVARSRRKISVAGSLVRPSILVAGMLIGAAAMIVPVPHRIECPTILQPTSQRFATAPHTGILKMAHVRPGDHVKQGQVLAEMDGVELELKHADLSAQRERAIKRVDVQRTLRDPSATQIASLEVTQLTAQLDLIAHQRDHLKITADVDGIVLQGDWHDARGAMVHVGDVLMQVAPLDTLRAELEVPERDVSYVQPGQSVRLAIDGNPLDTLSGKVDNLRPMSEIRNSRNVFLAEVILQNDGNRLRPGMRGTTKITADHRPLGWVMFHHAWESVYGSFR